MSHAPLAHVTDPLRTPLLLSSPHCSCEAAKAATRRSLATGASAVRGGHESHTPLGSGSGLYQNSSAWQ